MEADHVRSLFRFALLVCALSLTSTTAAGARGADKLRNFDVTELAKSSASLPGACYKPDGKTCDWYENCLEKVYPCKARGEQDYPMDFAEHYCLQFGNYSHDFSPQGRAWIDAARLCLQTALVPLLNESSVAAPLSCKNLTVVAFRSHEQCYLEPDKQNRSLGICALPCKDLALLVYIIWFRGHALTQEFGLLIESMLQVAEGCLKTKLACLHWNNSVGVDTELLRLSVYTDPSAETAVVASGSSKEIHHSVVHDIMEKLDAVFGLRKHDVIAVPHLDEMTSASSHESPNRSFSMPVSLHSMQPIMRMLGHGTHTPADRKQSRFPEKMSITQLAGTMRESLATTDSDRHSPLTLHLPGVGTVSVSAAVE